MQEERVINGRRRLYLDRQRRYLGDAQLGWLLLAPALLILVGVALYPLLDTLFMSLRDISLIFQRSTFVGLGNFAKLLGDQSFVNAYSNTAIFTVVSVLLETLFGLLCALVMNKAFRGRGLVRTAILIPWAIPTVVTSQMWGWIFNADYGILNYLLRSAGLVHHNINWLGIPGLAMVSVIIADVWKTTPFMSLLLLAGLQGIPSELYEAARIDGANTLQIFQQVTLPLLKPVMLIAILLRALDAMRVFDLVYVLTGGGPADATEVLSTYGYKQLFMITNFGYGSAVAVTMFFSGLVMSAIALYFLRTSQS